MRHLSPDFEAELRALRGALLAMGARCERAVSEAVAAFVERDVARAKEAHGLDARIDRDEVEIDALALRLLALRQPVADDLRFIATALKFVTDLERIGDEAKNIAERVPELSVARSLPPHPEVTAMSDKALWMLRESLDAFVARDAARAEAVLRCDAEVDALYGDLLQRLFGWMRAHPEAIPVAQSVVSVARYLERVGDHATNLAEHVVFMVRGEVVRHRGGGRDEEGR